MAAKGSKWLSRYLVADDKHIPELETKAAMLEFQDRMPRYLAEEKAYKDYRKDQHMQAAAHHLRGLKASQSSGDVDEGRKHGAMYELHAKQAGFEPWAEIPADLHPYLAKEKMEPAHKFKAHRGDMLVLDQQNQKSEPDVLEQLRKAVLDRLKAAEALMKGE